MPSGQIGPRALALIGVLGSQYHLTQFKVRNLLAHILGVNFSVGAISQAHGKVAQALHAPVSEVATFIAQSPVLHIDETRYPREGVTNWTWAAVQPKLAVFSILPSRARYVAQAWVLFRWCDQGRDAVKFARLQRRVHRTLTQGSNLVCTRTSATCANLLKIWPALWTFVGNPDVPPTNNAAERAIRSVVLKRKISGPTRSKRGDDFVARSYTVMESCLRQGRSFLDFTHQAVLAWINGARHPSLDPVACATG